MRDAARAAASRTIDRRDEEIALLMRRWERARQGEGQLVLIVGEPGVYSLACLRSFITARAILQLLQNTPLYPIAEWGRQRFGGPEIPAERRLADLENSLA